MSQEHEAQEVPLPRRRSCQQPDGGLDSVSPPARLCSENDDDSSHKRQDSSVAMNSTSTVGSRLRLMEEEDAMAWAKREAIENRCSSLKNNLDGVSCGVNLSQRIRGPDGGLASMVIPSRTSSRRNAGNENGVLPDAPQMSKEASASTVGSRLPQMRQEDSMAWNKREAQSEKEEKDSPQEIPWADPNEQSRLQSAASADPPIDKKKAHDGIQIGRVATLLNETDHAKSGVIVGPVENSGPSVYASNEYPSVREPQEPTSDTSSLPVTSLDRRGNNEVEHPGAYAVQDGVVQRLNAGVISPHQRQASETRTLDDSNGPSTTNPSADAAPEVAVVSDVTATHDIEARYRESILQDAVEAKVIPGKKPWRARLCVSCALLLVIGVVVGVTVPLTTTNNDGASVGGPLPPNNSPSPTLQPTSTVPPTVFPTLAPTRQPFVPVTVAILFDSRPGEVGWSLVCDGVVHANIPTGTYSEINGDFEDQLINETFQVKNGSPCQFTITDRSGLSDGDGEGYFQVFLGELNAIESILVGEGSDFDDEEEVVFVATPVADPAWSQIGQDINGEEENDLAGTSVSISLNGSNRTVVAVGSPWNGRSGQVRVFQYDPMTSLWTQLGQSINGTGDSENFGSSVALSANATVLAVAATGDQSNGVPSSARVYRYVEVDNWTQIGEEIVGKIPEESFGLSISVSLSRDPPTTLAIAAPLSGFSDSNPGGTVRVYRYDSAGEWIKIGQDITSDGGDDSWGMAMCLSNDGSMIAIGAPGDHPNEVVRVFRYDPATDLWVQFGQDIRDEGVESFGAAIDLSASGTSIAIGAPQSEDRVGQVQVFQYNPEISWTRMGQTIKGDDGDNFGQSLSLSDDATVVAVGAIESWRNGARTGHVSIYEFNAMSWTQVGDDIRGEGRGEEFGGSVSLGGDGCELAVGAAQSKEWTGHVEVFTRNVPGCLG